MRRKQRALAAPPAAHGACRIRAAVAMTEAMADGGSKRNLTEERGGRLAAALRANLRRRKSQERARAARAGEPGEDRPISGRPSERREQAGGKDED